MSVRKRINQNSQLTLSQDNEPCNFSDEDPAKISVSVDISDVIPDKYFVGQNLNDLLPNYREKRKLVKNQREIDYWNKKIQEQLSLYSVEDDKYNIKLVKAICQIVERYMIYDDKLGSQKKRVVLNCCLKFFDNNELLLESIIEEVLQQIDRSTLLMRLIAKLEILFFSK